MNLPEQPQLPAPEEPPQEPTPTPPSGKSATPSPSTDKGFPEGTPLEVMTPEQREAYWKHYARKHEDAVKGFGGLTPQQVAELQAKVEELEAKNMSADEKMLKTARQEAFKQATAEAEAKYLPQIRAATVQSIASKIVTGEQLSAFMDVVDTSKLLDEHGAVSEQKITGYLTAMYGEPQTTAPRWQNFGQYSPPPPRGTPGAGGSAEAAKRFGTKTQS